MTRAVLALVVSVCVLGLVACPPAGTPCTPADTLMIAHAAECKLRVRSCGSDQDCRNAVFADCDAWGEARCGFVHADGGEAGAP